NFHGAWCGVVELNLVPRRGAEEDTAAGKELQPNLPKIIARWCPAVIEHAVEVLIHGEVVEVTADGEVVTADAVFIGHPNRIGQLDLRPTRCHVLHPEPILVAEYRGSLDRDKPTKRT